MIKPQPGGQEWCTEVCEGGACMHSREGVRATELVAPCERKPDSIEMLANSKDQCSTLSCQSRSHQSVADTYVCILGAGDKILSTYGMQPAQLGTPPKRARVRRCPISRRGTWAAGRASCICHRTARTPQRTAPPQYTAPMRPEQTRTRVCPMGTALPPGEGTGTGRTPRRQ